MSRFGVVSSQDLARIQAAAAVADARTGAEERFQKLGYSLIQAADMEGVGYGPLFDGMASRFGKFTPAYWFFSALSMFSSFLPFQVVAALALFLFTLGVQRAIHVGMDVGKTLIIKIMSFVPGLKALIDASQLLSDATVTATNVGFTPSGAVAQAPGDGTLGTTEWVDNIFSMIIPAPVYSMFKTLGAVETPSANGANAAAARLAASNTSAPFGTFANYIPGFAGTIVTSNTGNQAPANNSSSSSGAIISTIGSILGTVLSGGNPLGGVLGNIGGGILDNVLGGIGDLFGGLFDAQGGTANGFTVESAANPAITATVRSSIAQAAGGTPPTEVSNATLNKAIVVAASGAAVAAARELGVDPRAFGDAYAKYLASAIVAVKQA